ncbi:MAG: hypothetical protein OJJ55_09050 [Rhodococcus sp.]|uniref:carboxyl transferase domain-containing protein n=1 Tax=Rhodococcus TaxID=1827 RepID=UPI001C4DE254|nr:carboxyl transferase domain-containing protein [Rhodococcus qingshengii]MCW0191438.1 hypothetical protein [Rhodococcus sp. (in: high G+C Gram-positive bacteria)]
MAESAIGTSDESFHLETRFLEEWDRDLVSMDPLSFPGYEPPVAESVRCGTVSGAAGDYVLIDCDFSRQGGTMGVVAGERIVRAFHRATDRGLSVAYRVSSGGARLQEGMFSLVQMARTSSALVEHRRAGLMTAAALRNPTTGGVYASWASGADVRIATPGAVIGFGGPRVVEQVTGFRPPATSHTAESAYANGLVDDLVPEEDQQLRLEAILGVAPAPPLRLPSRRTLGAESMKARALDTRARIDVVRSHTRASGLDWAARSTDSWIDLHGTDPSIRAGIATIDGERAVVVAMDRFHRGGGTGLPGPGAFRLARRAIALADRLRLPLVTFVDTPGADPSPTAEAGGIAHEIGHTLTAMAALSSVSVCVVVGEGGSGGAMALAHADHVGMLAHSLFWVIGPEAGAAVLYRDPTKTTELARSFEPTAAELVASGFADCRIQETSADVRRYIVESIRRGDAGNRNARLDSMTVGALTIVDATVST